MAKIKKAQRGDKVPKGYVRGEMTDRLYTEKEYRKHQDEFAKGLQQMKEQYKKDTSSKKPVVKKKMKEGGSLKPVAADQKGLAKLPTPVRNKMGYQKDGGKLKKAKSGATLSPSKKSVSSELGGYKKVIGKNYAGKAKSGAKVKKMMGGGKCKYGC